jgi:2-polyprenyl-3-methyl-5-hydroxy-6-metoxy-1,4-benzoquinol methylase
MPQPLEIDVDRLMEQIRASRERGHAGVIPSQATAAFDSHQEPAELAFLQSSYDIYHIDFTSHRKVLGRVVLFLKRVLRQLMTPILERQCAFNAASARVASHLQQQTSQLQQQSAQLQQQSAQLQQQSAQLQQQSAQLQQRDSYLHEQMEEVRQQRSAVLQALRQDIEAFSQQQAADLQALRQDIEAFSQQQAAALQALRTDVANQIQTLGQQIERGRAEIDTRQHGLEKQFAQAEKALSRLKVDHILLERRVAVLLEEARRRLPEPMSQQQLQVFASEHMHRLDALYVSFEDQFRGTREDIKARFQVYLPLLKEAMLGSEQVPILDVGCGRGEWLELLQEEGLRAQGIDLNRVLVEACRSHGLTVAEGEAIAYLSTMPPNSLGAVTGFHIIEHLPFDRLIALLDETVRVLKPGGVAIFETPNPENILVGSCNFYLDPTHRNPLPSSMVKFIAEARGLCRVEIMNLHPYPESYRVEGGGLEVAQRFNEYFYGPQDYAIIGWKV